MIQFTFEQRGGRCKLLLGEDGGLNPVLPFRPCSPEEIQEALLMKEAKAKEAKEAKRRNRAQKREQWEMVCEFLKSNRFAEDVNAPKCHHFGFVKTYPLHQAAKDGNWQMMNLLMTFGADPKQKDSAGKRAIQYAVMHGQP
eukprot:symbB.v1.2.034523.t1/scaffold4438.1/size39648/2